MNGSSNHGFQHQNHDTGRLSERTTPTIRQRTGLGSDTEEVLTMGRTHTGHTHYHARGLIHPSPSHSRMDQREWNLEHPTEEMGTNLGNTTKSPRILCNPTTARDSQHLHPYKTHPPDNQTGMTGGRNPRTPSSSSAHLLPHGL